jgi:predicted secreted protein
MNLGDKSSLHVHLMGEMTFTVALVKMLQKSNIRVVCSTTKRIVLEEKEGVKTAKFQFIQFRDYP